MKRQLVISRQFEKAYKKFAGKDNRLRSVIAKALERLSNDVYDPLLRTHKLSGKLAAFSACYCGYDCRIIFIIEKDIDDVQLENIILLNVGTHDDVY